MLKNQLIKSVATCLVVLLFCALSSTGIAKPLTLEEIKGLKGEEIMNALDLVDDEPDLSRRIALSWGLFERMVSEKNKSLRNNEDYDVNVECLLSDITEQGEADDVWKALSLLIGDFKTKQEVDSEDLLLVINPALENVASIGHKNDLKKMLAYRHVFRDGSMYEEYFLALRET